MNIYLYKYSPIGDKIYFSKIVYMTQFVRGKRNGRAIVSPLRKPLSFSIHSIIVFNQNYGCYVYQAAMTTIFDQTTLEKNVPEKYG